ncbi:MAG: hypothetical protein WDW38_000710 [Sanguina aurantia]
MAHMWWFEGPSPLGLNTTRHDSDDPATAERGKVQEHLRSGETWPGKPSHSWQPQLAATAGSHSWQPQLAATAGSHSWQLSIN